MTQPLLAACLIVKDEAHAIARTIESLRDAVDVVAVVDTGSTDGTIDTIRALLPGDRLVLEGAPFDGYAKARNTALLLARRAGARYALSLSADEELIGGDRLRAYLDTYAGDETAFNVTLRTETGECLYPRVLAVDSSWRYEGVVQEMPVNHAEQRDVTATIPGVVIEHRATDPERRLARMREFDLPTIEVALAHAETNAFWRARYTLFLGQTHEALAAAEITASHAWWRHVYAAMGAYSERAQMPSAPVGTFGPAADEAAFATWRFLNLADQACVFSPNEALVRWGEVVKSNPTRPEPALMLAMRVAQRDPERGLDAALKAMDVARAAKAKAPSRLPIDPQCEWQAWRLAAACAKASGQNGKVAGFAKNAAAAGAPLDAVREYL